MMTLIRLGERRLPWTRWSFWLGSLLIVLQVQALIQVGVGAPRFDPGWPAGTTNYVALKSLVQWYEGPPFGGGEWVFQSRGNTEALQEAIDAFSSIQGSKPEIVLKSGPLTNHFRASTNAPDVLDWETTVWVRANWDRLFGKDAPAALKKHMQRHPDGDRSEPPLRLVVHLHPGGPDWSAIRIPAGIPVNDSRTGTEPARNPGPAVPPSPDARGSAR